QLSQARHVAMYLCRQYTSESLASIARAFGRSHSTVLYAVRRMQQELDGKNASLKRQVDYISRRLETGCLFP
ncbi:MAG: helix-turn-helix domain-containing protein, partial [Thermodesulfobacteriota bacterium]|nr:helix-turn-helix domain-containing protein [Thermodesulfobacteriota bacterium]